MFSAIPELFYFCLLAALFVLPFAVKSLVERLGHLVSAAALVLKFLTPFVFLSLLWLLS